MYYINKNICGPVITKQYYSITVTLFLFFNQTVFYVLFRPDHTYMYEIILSCLSVATHSCWPCRLSRNFISHVVTSWYCFTAISENVQVWAGECVRHYLSTAVWLKRVIRGYFKHVMATFSVTFHIRSDYRVFRVQRTFENFYSKFFLVK